MKISVTGANGYVGRHITAALRTNGHTVIALGRRDNAAGEFRKFSLEDGSTPHLANIETLIHAAWDFRPREMARTCDVNVEGTRRLVRAARDNGVRRIVFISTMSAFVGCSSVYGRAKLAAEDIVLQANGIVLRPGLVWGMRAGGMVGLLDRLVQMPVTPVIAGGGRLRLIHANDLGTLASMAATLPGLLPQVITVAHPESFSLAQIIGHRARAAGRHPLMLPVPWQAAWAGLRALEILRPSSGLRSDSVIGLVHSDPAPDFRAMQAFAPGMILRPFP